jgi:ATP-binding cassette subfamily F protein 3
MIHAHQIAKAYGPKVLFRDGAFQINTGEKIGLVGPNGNGKTTIFRLITGQEALDSGQISKPDRARVAYFSQDIENMRGQTVLHEVINALPELERARKQLQELEVKLSEPLDEDAMALVLERYGEAQVEFERLGGYDVEARAAEILTGLGIGPHDQQRDTGNFSGGWKMRIALAKVLIQNPEVLLMDEPTNHLDLESILWLEQWLMNYPGALVMTSHDREFMNRIVKKIIEVAHQKITTFSGNYDYYEKEKAIRREQLEAQAKRQEDMLAKEHEFIARFAARASHAAQVQSRVKKLEKIERVEVIKDEPVVNFEWPTPPRGGDEVVKIQSLSKIWTDETGREKLVFKGANGLVRRLDRVAVVGVNGAGKSTLLKIIAGQTEPTAGTAALGASIEMGYFSQNALDVLDPNSTVVEEVHSVIPTQSLGYVRTLLGALKFSGDEVEKKIKSLSGGEKSRVVLAKILSRPVNFLVLDEPTNHLDIATREVLLNAIKTFEGTVMIVSHDRYFLKEITTRVFELDQNELRITDGNLDYYLEKRLKLLNTAVAH